MKQVFTILSAGEAEPTQQLLSVRIGERHLGFAITSLNGQQVNRVAWYAKGDADEQSLEEIYSGEPALQAAYPAIHLCYDYPRSVLVPLSQYKEDDRQILIRSMYGISSQENLFTEKVEGWQLNNVYAVPEKIQQWVRARLLKAQSWHGYTIGIRNIESTDFEGALVADFRTDDFSLIVSRANKLLLAQTFAYTTPADVIYYLLKACQDFSFSQDTVRLSLSGLIDRESALYREIYQYFIQVRFREASWTLPATETVYPAHFFTSLNDLARCES